MSAGAREAILARIAGQLGKPAESAGLGAAPARATIPAAERYEAFRARLESVGGRVQRVADLAAARAALLAILRASGARRLFVSDAALVGRLVGGIPRELELELVGPFDPRARQLEAEVGLSTAQWGLAETGTLVLESARENHRQASLLPPIHVVLLPAEAILGTLGEGLAAVQDGAPGSTRRPASRTITFITGPSRTADIELTLVVGVHGPGALHVLVLDSVPDSEAPSAP